MTRVLLVFAGCLFGFSNMAEAQTADVDYLRDIKPILRARCYSCHGGLKQESGLRLDTGAFARKGGDSGPAVIAGNVEDSPLVERVGSDDESLRMPPEGDALTPAQIELLKQWVASGAAAPNNEQAEEDPYKHWAFQKPKRPEVPRSDAESWVRNPIDAFIAKQHRERGLIPAQAATKEVLLRRVYLDLIGLPPGREELRAFLADDSSEALNRVVDDLLERPQYGERWGRHWMDVWRYSDWYGRRKVPDCLNSYGQIWRWRDWIVRSLNEDKGYDRMVMEMLAADEIAPGDDANSVATGFIVRNFYRWNYNTWMKDAVEHTGKAFLGLTLNCCHCHDHKYDPIGNEEYFRFRAFFEPIEIRHDRVAGEPDPGVYPKYAYGKAYKPITTGLVRIMDEKLDAETYVYTGGESRNVIPDRPPVTPGAPKVIGGDDLNIETIDLPPESWYPGLKPFVRREAMNKAEADVAAMKTVLAKAEKLVADAKDDAARKAAEFTLKVDQANVVRAEAGLQAVVARIHADRVRHQNAAGDPDDAARAASRAERQVTLEAARVEKARAERAVFAARQKQPADDKSLKAAETKLVETTTAAENAEKALEADSLEYAALSPKYPKQSTGRRAALANWIASKENPLTARVAVNHIWMRHFGRALVETTDNFGRSGASPTHPDLLDWLAIELMDNGWRMKHIHRLIVTSNVYRMASADRSDNNPSADIDADNVYLWRFNSRRMDAEVVRDAVLSVSGSLDPTIGGQEIAQSLGLTTPRRSLYFEHHGEGRMTFLDLFDAADPCDAYRRTTSVRPQQALALANSELLLREGRLLAQRLSAELESSHGGASGESESAKPMDLLGDFINAAFERILGRGPTPAESDASRDFLKTQTELFRGADLKEQEPPAKDSGTKPSLDPELRAKESFVHALFNHHDFLTIR